MMLPYYYDGAVQIENRRDASLELIKQTALLNQGAPGSVRDLVPKTKGSKTEKDI